MDKQEHANVVRAIAFGALQLDPSQRADFLLGACAGQTDLLNEVRAELASVSSTDPNASTVAMHVFAPGAIVGDRFRIVRFVAHGGMGSVYLAEDLQVGGRVALKTVRSDKTSEGSIERLRREVQLARQVTHRNVCRIYDLGVHRTGEASRDGFFLTMEFLEGKTLSQRLREAALQRTDVIEIALHVALALVAAHESGVIHGDLKSSNIMLVPTESGWRAVVTDFGLARIAGAARPTDPEASTTSIGFLGTPAYMSPEQILGSRLGPQSDLYSYGVVLFEMATGKLPFTGDVAGRLRGEIPRPSIVAPATDPRLEAIILCCLQPDLKKRYASAAVIVGDLSKISGGISRRKTRFVIAAAVVVLTIVAIVLAWRHIPWPALTPASSPLFIPVTNQPGQQLFPTLSPDATHVAYAWERNGDSDIYVQSVDGGQPIDITPDCKSMDSEPAWSPDGQRIAYRCERDGGGISISAADGSWNRKLTASGHQPSWSPDGAQVVVATERVADLSGLTSISSPLLIVNVKDGSVHSLPKGDGFQPSWSPGGQRIAFWSYVGGKRCIRTAAVGDGAVSELVADKYMNWNPVWSADGRWIYFLSDRGGTMNLWRMAVDEASGGRAGDPKPVVLPASYVQHISISRNGQSLTYVQRTQVANLYRLDFDSAASKTTAPVQLTFGVNYDAMPSIARDAKMVVFASGAGKPDQLYVVPATGAGARRQITDNTDGSIHFLEPRWSPDSRQIAFQSNLAGAQYQIWSIKPDGSDLLQLSHASNHAVSPIWNPDGSELAYSIVGGHSWLLNIASGRTEELPAPPNRSMQFIVKSWSADGRRIAGSLHRPDGSAAGIVVYVRSEHRYEMVTSFGSAPVWLKDGTRLLFRSGSLLFRVDTRDHSVIPVSLPEALHVSDTFALAHDNRSIVVSSSTDQANVWVAQHIR